MYWSTFDNCFQERRYTGERTISNGHISYPNHQTWTSQCVYERPGSIEYLFGNKNTASDDCRLTNQLPSHFSSSLLPTLEYRVASYDDYSHIAYRILLNPIPSLRTPIKQFIRAHYRYNPVVGVQIRTGGCIADYPEKVQMMLTSDLFRYPAFIQSQITRQNFLKKPIIVVATDSLYAFNYVRESLKDQYQVISSSLFNRSHTEFNPVSSSLYSAVVDVHLLAHADLLIICKGSGFGHVARSMVSTSTPVVEFDTQRRTANITLSGWMFGSNTTLLRSLMCDGIEFKSVVD